MADIELLIKIPEETYNDIQSRNWKNGALIFSKEWKAIHNGTPLPKGHGRLIDKDRMIARLEAASKFFGGENADAFDERFSHGLKEAAIKVAEEPTIIEADNGESEDKCKNCKYYRNPDYTRCHECKAESEE